MKKHDYLKLFFCFCRDIREVIYSSFNWFEMNISENDPCPVSQDVVVLYEDTSSSNS